MNCSFLSLFTANYVFSPSIVSMFSLQTSVWAMCIIHLGPSWLLQGLSRCVPKFAFCSRFTSTLSAHSRCSRVQSASLLFHALGILVPICMTPVPDQLCLSVSQGSRTSHFLALFNYMPIPLFPPPYPSALLHLLVLHFWQIVSYPLASVSLAVLVVTTSVSSLTPGIVSAHCTF